MTTMGPTVSGELRSPSLSSGELRAPSRVLVVDDNEMNRDLLARRLLRDGHAVSTAENGREGLAMMVAQPFDLVMLDIMMPEMNGYEVLERLKGDPSLRHIPVIMITAVDDPDSVVRCVELGAEDHLPKPFNPALLRARVGASLAKKRLHDREQLYARSLERELDIGREIQAGFLPTRIEVPAGWEIAARFHPARQVAGDFYDVFPLGSSLVGLVLADVCGKGVGAALFMALFRTLIRALAEQRFAENAPPADGLHATIVATNDYIARTHDSANMFATVFFAALDPRTGIVRYVNAGHEAAIIAGPDGVRARLASNGPAVGLMPDMTFGVSEATLDAGELLLLFTDGVTDARSKQREEFGEERLLALTSPPSSAAGLLERIDAAVAAHASGVDRFDDVTMLAVRRSG